MVQANSLRSQTKSL